MVEVKQKEKVEQDFSTGEVKRETETEQKPTLGDKLHNMKEKAKAKIHEKTTPSPPRDTTKVKTKETTRY